MLEYYESGPIPDNVKLQNGEPIKLTYRRRRVLLQAKSDYGQEAVFIPIDTTRGLKLYRCIKDGKLAHNCQEEAYGFGLGPEVLSPLLEIVFPLGSDSLIRRLKSRFPLGKAYGYYTQLADTRHLDIDIKLIDQVEELKTECMEKLSFNVFDLHSGNVGLIGDKLVLIDFGWATTGTPTRRPRGHFSVTHHTI